MILLTMMESEATPINDGAMYKSSSPSILVTRYVCPRITMLSLTSSWETNLVFVPLTEPDLNSTATVPLI